MWHARQRIVKLRLRQRLANRRAQLGFTSPDRAVGADPPALLHAHQDSATEAHGFLALGGPQGGAAPPPLDENQLGFVGRRSRQNRLETGQDLLDREWLHGAAQYS